MKPKEKALELLDNFLPLCTYNKQGLVIPVAKQCALIAVDEILDSCIRDIAHLHYWSQVKTEIENI